MPTTNQYDSHPLEVQRLRDIIAHNSDWLWEVDAQGRYTFCSPHIQLLLGYSPEQVLGRTPFDFMPPDEAARVGVEFAAIVGQQRAFSGLINRNLRIDGTIVVLETSGVPLFDEDGVLRGYRGIDRDISPAIGQMSARAMQLEALYAAAPVALGLIDREGQLVNANHALAQLLGIETAMIAGQIAESLLPGGSIDVKHCFERLDRGEKVPDGVIDWRECSYLLTIQAVQDTRDRVTGITLALTDVTEQQRMRQALAATNRKLEAANAQLSDLAENDYLTGLPNRRRFDEVLLSEVARAHRDNQPVSLLMLDVDHFKTYNDHYGHQAGDECMRRLAQIFRAGVLRPGDLICRYGGEEFAAILPDTEPEAALQVAERLRLSVFEAKLAHAGSASGRVTVSIGVGTLLKLYSVGTGSAALIKAADESLYAAKKSGRNQVCPAVSS